jgi:hypothetical protein
MKQSRVVAYLLVISMIHIVLPGASRADNAEVLPKGVIRGNITGNFYLPMTKRFNPSGDLEDIAKYFNGNLNSIIFPTIGLVENAFRMPPGSGSVGNSAVSFTFHINELITEFDYGLTDKLSVGVKFPYNWQKNSVDASLDTSHATLGLNPYFGSPYDPFKHSPLVPIAFGGIPLTTDQVRALLGPGVDINRDGRIDIPGYHFKPFQTWSDSGLADIEAGAKYQYYKSKNWRLAVEGGARFPTGQVDDPDNLVDLPFGSGAYALLFRSKNDYTGINNLILNATFRYDLYLPTSLTKRITDVTHPITENKDKVDIIYGSQFQLETGGTYQFYDQFNIGLMYRHAFKLKNRVSGNLGFDYSSLEEWTDWNYDMFRTSLSYSTFQLFQAKKFPLPLTVCFEYNNVFAGSNYFLQQQWFSVNLAVYF